MIPPFSARKLFETKNFLKNSRLPLRKFSALWDIKISTENRDKPSLIHEFFSIPENFRKTEGFLYKAFRFGPVRQKVSAKPWCPAPLLCMKIFDEKFFWNTKCSPMKNFGALRQKLRRKIVIPPPLIHKKFFPIINFLKHRMVPWRSFLGPVRWKHFRQNREASPSFAWNFSIPELFRNTEGFSYDFSRHCETKIFQRSSMISPSYA